MQMNIIASVDQNWAIGNKNKLLVRIPADMRFFREVTTGKTVIMGRATLESFSGAKPLPNRNNIVITKNHNFAGNGATVVHSIDEALEKVEGIPDGDIFIIGGASIYEQFLPYCRTAHITKVDFAYEADSYFPNLDKRPDWRMTGISEEQTYYDLVYHFCRYEKK